MYYDRDKIKLPIGIENEKNLDRRFYYIDKSGFIKELSKNWSDINLFTRSRRFGKTLNAYLKKTISIRDTNSKKQMKEKNYKEILIDDGMKIIYQYGNFSYFGLAKRR